MVEETEALEVLHRERVFCYSVVPRQTLPKVGGSQVK